MMDKCPDLDLAKKTSDSTKTIPTHGNDFFIKIPISNAETFVQKQTLETFLFLNPELKKGGKETYGFISTNPPPVIPELKDFENDVYKVQTPLY